MEQNAALRLPSPAALSLPSGTLQVPRALNDRSSKQQDEPSFVLPRVRYNKREEHGSTPRVPRTESRRAGQFVLAAVPIADRMLVDAQPAGLLSDTVRHVLAGTVARTLAQAIIHPIDTIKTRLQVRSPPEKLQKWLKKIKKQPFEIWLGKGRMLRLRNFAVRGPRDVYLGLTGAVLGTIPTALVYFSTYETMKSYLESRNQTSAVVHLVSASVGALSSALVRVPTDTLRHRVQAYLHRNVFDAAVTIVKQEGPLGLYSGFAPTLARDVPEIAIQFALYESLRQWWQKRRDVKKLQTWEHLALGGASGALAASATMPLDLVKTRLQCGAKARMSQVLAQTLSEGGVNGLFTGMGPRVMQVSIMSAAYFTLFEFWKLQLKPDRAPDDKLLTPKIWQKRRTKVLKRQFVYQ